MGTRVTIGTLATAGTAIMVTGITRGTIIPFLRTMCPRRTATITEAHTAVSNIMARAVASASSFEIR